MQEEKWICKKCGEEAPCFLSIKYSDEKLPDHLKGRQRLVKETCPFAASLTADWERVENNFTRIVEKKNEYT